jgi:hypothetical protein
VKRCRSVVSCRAWLSNAAMWCGVMLSDAARFLENEWEPLNIGVTVQLFAVPLETATAPRLIAG